MHPSKVRSFVLAPLLLLAATGCAHALPKHVQDGYWTCPGTSSADAEQNLARAFYPIKATGPGYVQTDWKPYGTGGQREAAYYIFGVSGMDLRLAAHEVPEGLAWTASYRQTQGMMSREQPIEQIYDSQVSDDRNREAVNRMRREVCGGTDYFKAPPRSQW